MLSQIALNNGKTLKANDLTETVRLGLDFTTSLGGTLLPQTKKKRNDFTAHIPECER